METVAQDKNLDLLMDVRVNLSVQLGSSELPMKEILELNHGAVVQLKQKAKDPVSLLVNGKLIAYGEVVVVEDNFGIKITEIIGINNDKEVTSVPDQGSK